MADKKITYDNSTYDFSDIVSDKSNKITLSTIIDARLNAPRRLYQLFNKHEGLSGVKKSTLENLVRNTVKNGKPLTFDEFKNIEGMESAKKFQGKSLSSNKNWEDLYNQYLEAIDQNKDTFGFDSKGDKTKSDVDPQQAAFNEYWNEMYSRNEDTLGAEAYSNMLAAEQNAARDAITLADAQAQQLAMAQAQTVKDITDSLRAERMSRLRAGMSESQIASQDMQTMMTNTNALNDQIMASNLGVLQGQQQYDNARTTAYNNWLNAMNQTATNGAAMAASDAGSAYQQAVKYAQATGVSLNKAYNVITGQQNQKQ